MKPKDKVRIIDGSGMTTISKGEIRHEHSENISYIEKNRDIWTIIRIGGIFPTADIEILKRDNDCIIQNDTNKEVWYCKMDRNIRLIENIEIYNKSVILRDFVNKNKEYAKSLNISGFEYNSSKGIFILVTNNNYHINIDNIECIEAWLNIINNYKILYNIKD